MADIVNELDCIDGQYAVYRWIPIAVQDYGSEGCVPLARNECPLESDGDVSCVGASGSNLCMGYIGHASSNVIRCSYGLYTTKENT